MSPTSVINTDMGQEQYLLIPVSIGELVDKTTILEIKKQNIKRQKAQENISNELQLLQDSLNSWTKKFPGNLNPKSACIKKTPEPHQPRIVGDRRLPEKARSRK